jgi:mono/diheme cytochrome c family protein
MIKPVAIAALLVILIGGAGFFLVNVILFERSASAIYDIPLPKLVASSDPSVIARGKHLAESLGKCMQCHGTDLGSGESVQHGPFGISKGPNLTSGENGVRYTDAELARLIKHGVKRDGRTVIYMPSNETAWWPMDDVVAIVSYLRTLPPVDGEPGYVKFGVLAKFFDRMDLVEVDIARHIDHRVQDVSPQRAPTPEYGAYIAKLCVRCHGERFSGGPMPGAPASLAVPSNLTPDASGLAAWTYEDFDKLLMQGIRKNGRPLDPFMALGAMGKLDETEKRALWLYLRALPPRKFGGH